MPKIFWPSKPLLPQPVSHQSTQNCRAKISGSPVLVPRTFCLIFYTARWSHVQNRAQLFVRGLPGAQRRLFVTPLALSNSGLLFLVIQNNFASQNPFSFPRLSPEHTPNQRPQKARSGWFFAPCLSRHSGILTPAQNSSRAPAASLARWPAATL